MLSFFAACDLCGAELYADNRNQFYEQIVAHEKVCK